MPRRRDERARVLGPTWCKDKQAWRVTTVDPKGIGGASGRTYRYFGDKEEARDWREVTEARLVRLEGTTFEMAFVAFEQELRNRGNKVSSVNEALRRIKTFFAGVETMQLARLRHDRAEQLYAAFREGRAVDHHRNALANAKGFMKWCVEQGWIAESPLAKVKGIGKRSQGKPQFTGDETRKWFAYVMDKAKKRRTGPERLDSDAAIGLLLLLFLGLRQSDVSKRVVRDLDLDATVLRIERGKTKKSNRPRKVPAFLQPLLRQVAGGRAPDAPLFPSMRWTEFHTHHWLRHAQGRFCKAAGLPYIPPHGLKGTAGSLLAETGELADRIADHLSHEDQSTTMQHYLAPGVVEEAQGERVFAVISGGRR